eukprot:TRINITY_DN59482_c0_g1_i1.p1 TRINITY_DN59482_c0_g1~~TRINITY_DN59482_c0_g1_i1.p1  ORF type:complete len:204 (-),score=22.74 TRINITY_DN59482_c0_g1_i1:420-1031(-)
MTQESENSFSDELSLIYSSSSEEEDKQESSSSDESSDTASDENTEHKSQAQEIEELKEQLRKLKQSNKLMGLTFTDMITHAQENRKKIQKLESKNKRRGDRLEAQNAVWAARRVIAVTRSRRRIWEGITTFNEHSEGAKRHFAARLQEEVTDLSRELNEAELELQNFPDWDSVTNKAWCCARNEVQRALREMNLWIGQLCPEN